MLAAAVRDALARREDPAKAARMQAYMKSAMPFRGVDAAGQRDVARDALAVHPPRTRDEWLSAILALWRDARYREERYLAIALARRARYRTFRTGALLPVWEEFIVDGAWWDYVDPIATHLVGEVVCAEPEVAAPVVRGWSAAENMWLRRAAIISQLLARERTDLELLFACIEPNLSDPEFFVRKAIGWALRELSKTNPEASVRYGETHALSDLSRREALKWLRHHCRYAPKTDS